MFHILSTTRWSHQKGQKTQKSSTKTPAAHHHEVHCFCKQRANHCSTWSIVPAHVPKHVLTTEANSCKSLVFQHSTTQPKTSANQILLVLRILKSPPDPKLPCLHRQLVHFIQANPLCRYILRPKVRFSFLHLGVGFGCQSNTPASSPTRHDMTLHSSRNRIRTLNVSLLEGRLRASRQKV